MSPCTSRELLDAASTVEGLSNDQVATLFIRAIDEFRRSRGSKRNGSIHLRPEVRHRKMAAMTALFSSREVEETLIIAAEALREIETGKDVDLDRFAAALRRRKRLTI